MDAGLNIGVGNVGAELLRNFEDGIDIFLLSMENKNANRDQERVDGERGNPRRSSKSRPEGGRKDGSAFAAVKIDSQASGQNDAEKWNHPNKNAEHAGLERGPNGDSLSIVPGIVPGTVPACVPRRPNCPAGGISGETSSGAGFRPVAGAASGTAICT